MTLQVKDRVADAQAVLAASPPARPDLTPVTDATVVAAEARLAAAKVMYEEARAAESNTIRRGGNPEYVNAHLARLDREDAAILSAANPYLEEAASHARRIYQAHGVSQRESNWYSGDMVESALCRDRWAAREQAAGRSVPSLRPLRFKTKSKAPDDRTVQAAEAAQTDEDYQKAAAMVRMYAAKAENIQDQRRALAGDSAAMRRVHQRARDHTDRVTRSMDAEYTTLLDLRARRDGGVPLEATRGQLTRLERDAATRLARNPDGTTNVWAYFPPDKNHPSGSYEPVVRVAGNTDGNALITANGKSVQHIEHWDHTSRGRAMSSTPTVAVAPAAPGATPLVAEGTPNRGFSRYIEYNE